MVLKSRKIHDQVVNGSQMNIKCCVQLSRQALRKKGEKIEFSTDDPNESRKFPIMNSSGRFANFQTD